MTRLGLVVDRSDLARAAFAAGTPPELASFAANLYLAVDPVAWLDDSVDYALAHHDAAIGEMFQPIENIVRDTPEGPGWSAVLDLERCPDDWLPWLAQFAGVSVVPGSTPDDMRTRIGSTDGFKRGTPDAIRAAAAATLTGGKTVWLRERYPADAYKLQVVTLTSETPSVSDTLAAIISQKPGGLVLDYHTSAGRDYAQLKATSATYAAVKTTYPTYADVLVQGLA